MRSVRKLVPWQHGEMPTALEDLIALLDLERIEENLFRGVQPDEDRQRVFGGQVAGQALVAASRTVDEPDRHVHSLHAYFLRPGDPTVPIIYEVDRIRDGRASPPAGSSPSSTAGRSSTCRRASTIAEPGLDYGMPAPIDVPPPDTLPDYRTRLAVHRDRIGDWYDRPRPIDTALRAHPTRRSSPV